MEKTNCVCACECVRDQCSNSATHAQKPPPPPHLCTGATLPRVHASARACTHAHTPRHGGRCCCRDQHLHPLELGLEFVVCWRLLQQPNVHLDVYFHAAEVAQARDGPMQQGRQHVRGQKSAERPHNVSTGLRPALRTTKGSHAWCDVRLARSCRGRAARSRQGRARHTAAAGTAYRAADKLERVDLI